MLGIIFVFAILFVFALLRRMFQPLKHQHKLSVPHFHDSLEDIGLFSFQDMSQFVAEMAPSIDRTANVLAPAFQDVNSCSYIWDSPSGKRVYIN